MNDMNDLVAPETRTVTIGHNRPPPDEALREDLRTEHSGLLARRDELLAALVEWDGPITTEEDAGDAADLVEKQVGAFLKEAKAVHQKEKAPWLSAGRVVDAFLHALIDNIERAEKAVNVHRKAYADRKQAEERARLAEIARKAQEEARIADEKAKEQERQRIAAEKELDRQRQEAERKQREIDEAEIARLKTEADLDAALAREAELKQQQADREAQDEIDRNERARVAQAAIDEAKRTQAEADKAAKAAEAKPAVLGRSRGAYGGMTTLREFWNVVEVNRLALDLDALRPHLGDEALEKACKAWAEANGELLKAGGALRGAVIRRDTRL